MRLTRRAHATILAAGFFLSGTASATVAWADPLPTSAEHVATPGRSVASDDTADAIVLNPANLGWLPAGELRWTWVNCPDDAIKVGCGMDWGVATPLPFGLATGLRVDLVEPPWGGPDSEGIGFPYRGSNYAWITWALALKLWDRASFGMSIAHSYSQDTYVDSLWGLTAALSYRPDPHLGFSAVAYNFNQPSPMLVPSLSHVAPAQPVLDGQYTFAMALRPAGTRSVDLGFEMKLYQGTDLWVPRGTLGIDVPYVGRVSGSVEIAHLLNDSQRGVLGTAGLELHFGGLSAGGGALFGNGFGGTAGEYVTAALAGYTQPGLPFPNHAVWIRLESTPGTRGHVALLRTLWRLSERRDVDAVTLVLRADPASSFAHAEEIADAIRVLQAHGKKVLCSWEDAGAKAIYVCASADRIVINPAGGVRYAGLKAEYIYLKGLLDKIGVRAEFVRVGPHKTAPEQFTNEHAGPVAAADHIDMLRQQEAVFVRNQSLYRHVSEEHVREVTRHGPFIATEAREAGFVDGFAFDDELDRATRELAGHEHLPYIEYEDETRAPIAFAGRRKVAILYLDGDIVDGRSQHVPILDMRLVGSYSMAEAIKQLREDDSVGAVVLRIESPGGSSLASDVMWRELVLLGKRKPLVVSMGTVAASGGYYVASASKNIFALPLTVTGSIGVFYGKADLSGLLDKIGVTVDTYKTAPRADAESLFRGFTEEEERELAHKVDQFYDTFLDRVSQSRGMTKAEVDAIGRGRVWMGQQAIEKHLVDHLGGLREALAAARAAANLPDDAPILESPIPRESLLEKAIDLATGGGGDHAAATLSQLPPPIRALARAVAPLVLYGSDEPLARMEWVDAGDWNDSP
jgi:protease-4